MHISFFSLALVAVWSCSEVIESKRVVDSTRTPAVRGGGKVSRAGRGLLRSDDSLLELGDEELLEEGPLEESYSFLGSSRYTKCFTVDINGQGSCNTCWAFSVQKMMQARLCKRIKDSVRLGIPFFIEAKELSPLNLICHLQTSVEGRGICDAKSIGDALAFVKDEGLITVNWIVQWKKNLSGSSDPAAKGINELDLNVARPKAAELLPDEPDYPHRPKFEITMKKRGERSFAEVYGNVVTDVSQPSVTKCDEIFKDKTYKDARVAVKGVRVSAPPFTRDSIKRRISVGGPIVATIRLTWEFLGFTGSLFHPRGRQTFCRMARPDDLADYCDPAKRTQWDDEQKMQQVRPSGMSVDEWMESWYNHFVVLHGWGVKKTGSGSAETRVPYWIVENSWGRIYANDIAEGNNGAGGEYLFGEDRLPINSPFLALNHFVMIADEVAGAGGLEFTSREVYSVTV